MFSEHLGTVLCLEFSYEPRIPKRQYELGSKGYRKWANQSSLATPRSLQHLMSALLLHASVAVGMPEGSKYSCSPLATATSLSHVSAVSTGRRAPYVIRTVPNRPVRTPGSRLSARRWFHSWVPDPILQDRKLCSKCVCT